MPPVQNDARQWLHSLPLSAASPPWGKHCFCRNIDCNEKRGGGKIGVIGNIWTRYGFCPSMRMYSQICIFLNKNTIHNPFLVWWGNNLSFFFWKCFVYKGGGTTLLNRHDLQIRIWPSPHYCHAQLLGHPVLDQSDKFVHLAKRTRTSCCRDLACWTARSSFLTDRLDGRWISSDFRCWGVDATIGCSSSLVVGGLAPSWTSLKFLCSAKPTARVNFWPPFVDNSASVP